MKHFRACDGAQLALTESGSGTPVIFIHGWRADATAWDGIIGTIGPNVRSIAIDVRGSGASNSARGPYNLERFAADLRELVEHFALGPVVLVGHSMGATVALRLAVDAPSTTRGLVLIAPVPASGGGYSEKGEAFLRATAGDPIATRKWLSRTLADPENEATIERLCLSAARTPRAAAIESFESWAFANFAEATKAIEAPALVIAAERDAPDVAQRRVAALLPNAEYVVLRDGAHYAPVERAGEIAALILDFVQRL